MTPPAGRPRVVLLLGGARAGKSHFAERLAEEWAERVLYLATAQPGDAEMAGRIQRHRERRPAHWHTVEEPLAVVDALLPHLPHVDLVLLDCMTLWASNVLLAEDDYERAQERMLAEIDRLAAACRHHGIILLVVSNEVGQGVVPAYPLGRQFRDLLGRANQALARHADAVLYFVAGLPIELKSLSRQTLEGLGMSISEWPPLSREEY